MDPRTSTANTKNWRDAIKGIKLGSYIESHMSTLTMYEKSASTMNFYETLRNITIPYCKSIPALIDPELNEEFQALDTLSDEALICFEKKLD